MTRAGRPAVFLDRDGTMNEEAGYLNRLDRLVLFPYAAEAIRLLNARGYLVVVITNQGGIARGFLDDAFVATAHRHVAEQLAAGGARVDAFYYCPHHPLGVVDALRGPCECRKPQPGMFRRAAADLGIDLSRSFVIGDRWHDLEAGKAVGARGVLVRTGYGTTDEQSPKPGVVADAVVADLLEAAKWVVAHDTFADTPGRVKE
jgi:D-glycero-D-manno-heptose 1,7-bisphosphate phosphatase